MSTITIPHPIRDEPGLLSQTVVVIGGSSGIGFETARRGAARAYRRAQGDSHRA
jgi:NAD(P)-dependent dehydrogenase (short-subunit alcohol dehydrogenase family)